MIAIYFIYAIIVKKQKDIIMNKTLDYCLEKFITTSLLSFFVLIFTSCLSFDNRENRQKSLQTDDHNFISDSYLGIFVDSYIEGEQNIIKNEIFDDLSTSSKTGRTKINVTQDGLVAIKTPENIIEVTKKIESIAEEIDLSEVNRRVDELNVILIAEYDEDGDELINEYELKIALEDRKQKRLHRKNLLTAEKETNEHGKLAFNDIKEHVIKEHKRHQNELKNLKTEFGEFNTSGDKIKKVAKERRKRREHDYLNFMARFDDDDDGLLTQKELDIGYKKHYREHKEEKLHLHIKVDKDGDGILNDKERRTFVEHEEKQRKRIEKDMIFYDSNGDGKLSQKERKNHLKFEEHRREHRKDYIYGKMSGDKLTHQEINLAIDAFEKMEESKKKWVEKHYPLSTLEGREKIHTVIKNHHKRANEDRAHFLDTKEELTLKERKVFYSKDLQKTAEKEKRKWKHFVTNQGDNKKSLDQMLNEIKKERRKLKGKRGSVREQLKKKYLK
jgi:hypothetical protein